MIIIITPYFREEEEVKDGFVLRMGQHNDDQEIADVGSAGEMDLVPS